MPKTVATLIEILLRNADYAHREPLKSVLLSETFVSSSGFPYVSREAFETFKAKVPHKFQDGKELLELFGVLDQKLATRKDCKSVLRAIKVCRQIVNSTAICSPPDLWVLKHVLSALKTNEVLSFLGSDSRTSEDIATKLNMEAPVLDNDFSFLYSRGILERELNEKTKQFEYSLNTKDEADKITSLIAPLPLELTGNIVPELQQMLMDANSSFEMEKSFFKSRMDQSTNISWYPRLAEIELGFRIVPLILAMNSFEQCRELKYGFNVFDQFPVLSEGILKFLKSAGYVEADGNVTMLGERVFSKGPGPFGIIYTYFSYMEKLTLIQKGQLPNAWVSRGANVAASRDANAKSFKSALDGLKRFCEDWNFKYSVFIEHAVGKAEATRQHASMMAKENIQYIGADLEDAAIDAAKLELKKGKLPSNMLFLHGADIGKPQLLLDFLSSNNLSPNHAVMIVGNGFHEIRSQSDEKMVDVFKAYQTAGILLVFIEESAIFAEDIRNTAWNTYHAGFKYVHELSGQGLRPVYDNESDIKGRLSWKSCVEKAGYHVAEAYGHKSRTIYPHPRKDGKNPAISVTYFCIPASIRNALKYKEPNGHSK